MHINSMPDLVLRRIFHKVPICDLLWLGHVCLLWESNQLEICKQVRSITLLIGLPGGNRLITKSCFTLKYLDLLLNEDGSKMYSSQHLPKWFHLGFESFTLNCAEYYLSIFPCITTLEIAFKYDQFQIEMISTVIALLTKWSPTLKSLKMYFYQTQAHMMDLPHTQVLMQIDVTTEDGKIVNLLKVINSLSSLEHLTLNYNGTFFTKQPYELSILGQLREFYLDSLDEHTSIVKSLEQYAVANDNLQQIGLRMRGVISAKFYQRFPQLQNKVCYLFGSHLDSRLKNLIEDILPFTSITFLYLWPDRGENIFTGGLNFLASLKQLKHLQVEFDRSSYFSSLQSQNPQQVSRDKIVQLFSIQVLVIGGINCQDYFQIIPNLESPNNNWAYLFPNVQAIELILYYCKPKTIRNLLATFVQCPKLSYLYTWEIENRDCLESRLREWILTQFRDRKVVCGDIIRGPSY